MVLSRRFLGTFLLLALAFASVAQAQQSPPPPTAVYLPYWYVDGNTDALLHLSMNADALLGAGVQPYSIPVMVSLVPGGNGTPVAFSATVPVAGVLEVSLKSKLPPLTNPAQPGAAWGNGLKANSAWGTMTITLAPNPRDTNDILAVDAEVATVAIASSLTLSETKRLGLQSASATVWRPAPSTRLYLVLQEASGAGGNVCYLSLNGGPSLATVQLPVNGGIMLDITSGFGVGQAGDFEVNTAGSLVVATALAIDETTTMSVSQVLSEPALLNTLYSPPIKVGVTGWGAQVAIANLSNSPGNMLATLMWYNNSGSLINTPGLTFGVPANSAVVYDLLTLTNGFMPSGAAYVALRLDEVNDYPPRAWGATVFGLRNGSFNLVTPWRMYDETQGTQEKSAVGFLLGTGASDPWAMIAGTNAGPNTIHVSLIVSYVDTQGAGHQYALAPVSVDSGGFIRYNIKTLRDNQTPDANGNVLPLTMTTGSAHLWSDTGDLIGSDMSWSEAGGWAIQCDDRCGPHKPPIVNGIATSPTMCRAILPPQPVLEVQDYHVLFGTAAPRGGTYITFGACQPLTHCGSLKPVVSEVAYSYIQGQHVIYLDLGIPLGIFGVYQLCLPIRVDDLGYDPCPGG
jgi:hypothetical protein